MSINKKLCRLISLLMAFVFTVSLVFVGNEVTFAETSKDEPLVISTSKDQPTGNQFEFIWYNRGELYQVLTYRALFVADYTMTEFEPDLAEGYELSEDQLTYEITLKDGLKWSDGEDLTAEDVKFSIEGALRAGKINSIYTAVFLGIEGAEEYASGDSEELPGLSVDGNLITLKLTRPNGNTIPVLSQFAILPKHKLENADMLTLHQDEFWSEPVTNGMYAVEEVNIDNYIALEPNEYYEKEQPKIKKIVVRQLDDEITAALAGETTYTYSNKANQINQLLEAGNFEGFPVNSLYYRFLLFNIEKNEEEAAIVDPKVREAILYGMDREAIVKGLFGDKASVNDSGVPSSDELNYNTENTVYKYDPEKAKAFLEEAGYDFDQTLRFHVAGKDLDFAQAAAAYLEEIGMKVEVAEFQGDRTTEYFEICNYDLSIAGLAAFGYDEWYSQYVANANFENIIGKPEAFVELYQNYMAESNPETRAEILKELQSVEQEALLKGPLYMMPYYVLVDTTKVDIGDTQFGNPKYAYDLGFENWTLK